MARSGHVCFAVLLLFGLCLHFHALGIIIREPVECVDECPQGCFFGNTLNARGCPRCTCNNPILCRPLSCGKLSCPFGFKKNELGCNTCACNPRPCGILNCAATICPNGYLEINGCPTCQCKPEPRICPGSKCRQFRCINPETFIDENGCEVCSCGDHWLQIQR